MIKSLVMQGTKRKSIFYFIRAAFMFNGNDVCRIEQIELDAANTTAVTISAQYIRAKTRVSPLRGEGEAGGRFGA